MLAGVSTCAQTSNACRAPLPLFPRADIKKSISQIRTQKTAKTHWFLQLHPPLFLKETVVLLHLPNCHWLFRWCREILTPAINISHISYVVLNTHIHFFSSYIFLCSVSDPSDESMVCCRFTSWGELNYKNQIIFMLILKLVSVCIRLWSFMEIWSALLLSKCDIYQRIHYP